MLVGADVGSDVLVAMTLVGFWRMCWPCTRDSGLFQFEETIVATVPKTNNSHRTRKTGRAGGGVAKS